MARVDECNSANRRVAERLAQEPRAIAAHYDRDSQYVKIQLSSSVEMAFPAKSAQGLEAAKAAQLEKIIISRSGLGIYFPELDVDLYVPSLLAGFLGSRKWAAAKLGSRGGRSRSEAKAAASRRNGRLGGRPRKRASRR
jgi:hypothetical protein